MKHLILLIAISSLSLCLNANEFVEGPGGSVEKPIKIPNGPNHFMGSDLSWIGSSIGPTTKYS